MKNYELTYKDMLKLVVYILYHFIDILYLVINIIVQIPWVRFSKAFMLKVMNSSW